MQQRRFAVVENEQQDQDQLKHCIERWAQERGFIVTTAVFGDGLTFLENYRPVYDIVFMDIDMPQLNGMDTARRLRLTDEQVALIFITRMAQYAINGYEVGALDYMLKPVLYGTLADKIDQVLRRVDQEASRETYVVLNEGADSFRKLMVRDIVYIVKDRNYLRYVTRDGEFLVRGTLRDVEEQFDGSTVVKCANGCMVNMRYIEQKVKNIIYIDGLQFSITRPYTQVFTERFMQYLRDGR